MTADMDKLQKEREASYEYGLPEYLQHDLDEYKQALQNGSDILDCLWGELYGSINIAEINDGFITSEHADYLRRKFCGGNKVKDKIDFTGCREDFWESIQRCKRKKDCCRI